jgi:hypothetical protein
LRPCFSSSFSIRRFKYQVLCEAPLASGAGYVLPYLPEKGVRGEPVFKYVYHLIFPEGVMPRMVYRIIPGLPGLFCFAQLSPPPNSGPSETQPPSLNAWSMSVQDFAATAKTALERYERRRYYSAGGICPGFPDTVSSRIMQSIKARCFSYSLLAMKIKKPHTQQKQFGFCMCFYFLLLFYLYILLYLYIAIVFSIGSIEKINRCY